MYYHESYKSINIFLLFPLNTYSNSLFVFSGNLYSNSLFVFSRNLYSNSLQPWNFSGKEKSSTSYIIYSQILTQNVREADIREYDMRLVLGRWHWQDGERDSLYCIMLPASSHNCDRKVFRFQRMIGFYNEILLLRTFRFIKITSPQ